MSVDIKPYLSQTFWLNRDDVVCRDENGNDVDKESPLVASIRVKVCGDCKTTLKKCSCILPTEQLAIVWNTQGFREATITTILENAAGSTNPEPVPPPIPQTFLERALPMIQMGVPVIPLREKTKIPFLDTWQKLATTDEVVVRQWADLYPNANCGSVARAELGGIWLFETDSKDVLDRMAAGGVLEPVTFKVRSRDSRFHFYFRNNHDSLARLENMPQGYVVGEDFSVRVDNAQCASPGSIHPITGEPYSVVVNVPIAEASPELITWLLAQRTSKKGDSKSKPEGWIDEPIEEGTIHDRMVAVAGKLRNAGFGEDDIYAVLRQKGDTLCYCEGGDPKNAGEFEANDEQLHQIARSMMNYKTGEQKRKDEQVYSNGVPVGSTEPSPQVQANPTGNQIEESKQTYSRSITVEQYLKMVDISDLSHPLEKDVKEVEIPPFDPTVMVGLAKEMTELVTEGTTLAPQFTYGIVKTIVGARMAAAGMRFQYLNVEPRRYFGMIGETGSGKGEAWRRLLTILTPQEGTSLQPEFKILNSMTSEAGTKDFFWEKPESAPVVCFIDEIEDFGNKTSKNRNPEMLGLLVEMADSTSITRALAMNKGRSQVRAKNDARLVAVMCGQDGFVYGEAFGSKRKQGILDRITPEFSVPVEAGDLEEIPLRDRTALLGKFCGLPYRDEHGQPQEMKMNKDAKDYLDTFWKSQAKEIRTKVRFYKFIMQDAYITTFCDRRLTVGLDDMQRAVRTHVREMIIREAHFGTAVGDKVGFYLAKMKQTTARMRDELVAGMALSPSTEVAIELCKKVAQSERDYLNKSNAYRDNEEHIFGRAWPAHVKNFLIPVKLQVGRNKRWTEKYLPAPVD